MSTISVVDAEALAAETAALECDKQAAAYRAMQPHMEDADLLTSYDRLADAFEAQAVSLRS
jgi:hypothetical protein